MSHNAIHEKVTALSQLDFPGYDDVTNAPSSDGTAVYVTGDGATTPEGVYVRESGSYVLYAPRDPGSGLEVDGSDNLQIATAAADDTVTLTDGAAEVSTGLTSTPHYLNVYLDPSGNGNNTANVKASARAFWDNGATEYKIEILEDGTSVGTPDIGVRVVIY